LIEPKLQLKLVATFVLVAAAATLLQAISLMHALNSSMATGFSGSHVVEQAPQIYIDNLLFGFAICVPIVAVVGVYSTFRMVGPAYRMRIYLQELAQKGYSGPCRIRRDDEFQGLCTALNAAVDSLRQKDEVARGERTVASSLEDISAPLPSQPAVSATAASSKASSTTKATSSV
jgi:HAMP domain-containing protein